MVGVVPMPNSEVQSHGLKAARTVQSTQGRLQQQQSVSRNEEFSEMQFVGTMEIDKRNFFTQIPRFRGTNENTIGTKKGRQNINNK